MIGLRIPSGFDGSIAKNKRPKASYYPTAQRTSEDDEYFYFGWRDVDGQSRISQQDRSTLVSRFFKGTVAQFDANWVERAELEYS